MISNKKARGNFLGLSFMISNFLDRSNKGSLPNNFTLGMGELIRQARVESKMSQAELAEKTYISQAAISQIETGKREVSAAELAYLSYALNKPITYFFPKWLKTEERDPESLSPLEKELVMQVSQLDDADLRRLIAQARALVDLNKNNT